MILSDLDLNKLSRLVSQQVDHVTCIECCKYYTVPTTASCGHTLCHSCWRGRRICAACCKQIEKKKLKLNIPLQNLTEHVSLLSDTFENLFNLKLDEFLLDSPLEIIPEPNKNVKEWLASSQNQFSAPVTSSTQSTQDHIQTEQITSDIQIHTENKRSSNPREIVHVPHQQDDWDKIEEMPDSDKNTNKNQNNVLGPMDIEPFEFMMEEDEEYTSCNPRRSSRQKENKASNPSINNDKSPQKNSDDSNANCEQKQDQKVTKTWNNVKKMRKEFSKLYKQKRNKLNVSIEMCKKTPNINKEIQSIVPEKLFAINDNTPEIIAHADNGVSNNNKIIEEDENTNEHVNININQNKSSINATKTINKYAENIVDVNKVAEVPRVAFFKKSSLQSKPLVITNNIQIEADKPSTDNTVNNDDIEITIKIGNTLANILIKKKDNGVQFKINSDREVQTSLENCNFNKRQISSPIIDVNNLEQNHNSEINTNTLSAPKATDTDKSLSKKNTASADTTTAQFEITESIEREMTKSLDFNEISGKEKNKQSSIPQNILENNRSESQRQLRVLNEIPEEMDLDIFDGESERVGNVTSLKSTKNTPSVILPSIKNTKCRTPLTNDKRSRDLDDLCDLPSSKKMKLTLHKTNTTMIDNTQKDVTIGNDNVNDEIMGNVVSNVNTYKEKNANKTSNIIEMNTSQPNNPVKNMSQVIERNTSQRSFINNSISNRTLKPTSEVKCSENIFSILENDSEILKTFDYKTQTHSQHPSTNKSKTTTDLDVMELCTPAQDNDSDESVVEDTPQKSQSFSKKKKNETTIANNTDNNITIKPNLNIKQAQNIQKNTDTDVNVISLSDTFGNSTEKSKNVSVSEMEPRTTLETPVTITKFVDQIKHKSTPMARKSLNFNNENCDPESTICPSSFVVAQTTQEREFLSKAFEHTLGSEKFIKNNRKVVKYCLAGSCLIPAEQSKVKYLCSKNKWTYVEKYTKDLTHLVVSVDEENKSQRSVKYMCALAGGKWIISYEWIQKCFETNSIVDEEPFEVLDGTGEPGPRRSRLAKKKLFTGISFYCMPPFSVLDVDTLKDILVWSGGCVVSEARDVRAGGRPALLLAEPEHTQEDQFIYLAMQMSVVPINYEWVLNCLGSYSLDTIYDLLLFPAALLPPIVTTWPPELVSRDDE